MQFPRGPSSGGLTGGERSTFFIHAAMATILKVSRVGFMAEPEYGIFSASIRTQQKN
jgi:hypothetical protein